MTMDEAKYQHEIGRLRRIIRKNAIAYRKLQEVTKRLRAERDEARRTNKPHRSEAERLADIVFNGGKL